MCLQNAFFWTKSPLPTRFAFFLATHAQLLTYCLLIPSVCPISSSGISAFLTCFISWLQAGFSGLPSSIWLSNILNTLAWAQDLISQHFLMDSLRKVCVFGICPFLRGSRVRHWFPTLTEPQILAILFLPILINFAFSKQILNILPFSLNYFTLGLSYLITNLVFCLLENTEVMKVHTLISQPYSPNTCIPTNPILFKSQRKKMSLSFSKVSPLFS